MNVVSAARAVNAVPFGPAPLGGGTVPPDAPVPAPSRFALSPAVVGALRVVIVLIAVASVASQAVLAWCAATFACGGNLWGEALTSSPVRDVAYCVAGIAVVGCVECVLVAMWRLLTLARGDAVFTGRALRWDNVVIAAGCAACAVTAAVCVDAWAALLSGSAAHAASGMLWGASLAGALVLEVLFVLVMVVLRVLLLRATAQRDELAGVI